jgi:phosphate transport system substrate-binding protein
MYVPATMSFSESRWRIGLVCCCATLAFTSPAASAEISRLYVEPFTTQSRLEELRGDVVAELRKLNRVSIVDSQSHADAILGGGGEIWLKGYRSLNPRSGRLPSAGTPVYGGFLSVELRNTRGETLWSYLATPQTPSEDVARDLAKRIARRVVEGLDHLEAPPAPTDSPPGPVVLKGAGATFPYPVYEKWLTNYRREHPNLEITYDPIGSEAGIRRLLAGDTDFGATDSQEAIRDVAPDEEGQYLLFPSVVGAVVPIVNLPGFSGDIQFTPEALAGIYLGRIERWNDPVLKQANPRVSLPALPIVVVHRADGSGTTYVWTDFLSKTVPEWKERVGSALAPSWPVGRTADRNEGVAALVQELGGSIGYVEFIYALKHHLSIGKVRNLRGQFVGASLESIAVAADQAPIGNDFKASLVNASGSGAYPLTSLTWIAVPAHIADEQKRIAVVGFLGWMLGPGQLQAAALGYGALPKELAARERAAIAQIH